MREENCSIELILELMEGIAIRLETKDYCPTQVHVPNTL